MLPGSWSFIRYAAIILGVGIIGWAIYAHIYDIGYDAGKAELRAFYQPIIEVAERNAYEAEGRAKALATATQAVNAELERQHAQFTTTLAERERAARDRLSHSMRVAAASCDRGDVSGDAGAASTPDGAAPELERSGSVIDRIAADLVAVGVGCEQDAATVSAWQAWYRQQRAMMDEPLTGDP